MVVINEKKDCCGCKACIQVCPVNAIESEVDFEGFTYPKVNIDLCINCDKCDKACPIQNKEDTGLNCPECYVGYSEDENLRMDSSSGGIFSEIAKWILNNDGIVYGAALDSENHLKHVGISDASDLDKLRGSKYVQSDIGCSYYLVKKNLENGKMVLFSGTPCQIAGLHSFLGKKYDNLYLVDLLCHGVPSPLVWDIYTNEIEEKYGAKISNTSFRDKKRGWNDYQVKMQLVNGTLIEEVFKENNYMKLFLKNICLRPSCYECRFKNVVRVSNITLGDAWGIENIYPDMFDNKGTSIIISHDVKGQEILDAIRNRVVIKRCELDKVLPSNADSRKSVKMHPRREKLFFYIQKEKNIEEMVDILKLTPIEYMQKELLELYKNSKIVLYRIYRIVCRK